MFFDKFDEFFDGVFLRDVEFDALFADVEVDFSGGAADVTEVGIGHFAWAVDDAAHDGDGDAFEVAGFFADGLGGCFEVEEGAAAAGAGDEFGFSETKASSLEDVVAEGGGSLGVLDGFDAEDVA